MEEFGWKSHGNLCFQERKDLCHRGYQTDPWWLRYLLMASKVEKMARRTRWRSQNHHGSKRSAYCYKQKWIVVYLQKGR